MCAHLAGRLRAALATVVDLLCCCYNDDDTIFISMLLSCQQEVNLRIANKITNHYVIGTHFYDPIKKLLCVFLTAICLLFARHDKIRVELWGHERNLTCEARDLRCYCWVWDCESSPSLWWCVFLFVFQHFSWELTDDEWSKKMFGIEIELTLTLFSLKDTPNKVRGKKV